MDNLISVRDAAELVGCAQRTLFGYITDGKLHSQKIGHAVILDRAEVERFAAARKLLKGQPVEA